MLIVQTFIWKRVTFFVGGVKVEIFSPTEWKVSRPIFEVIQDVGYIGSNPT